MAQKVSKSSPSQTPKSVADNQPVSFIYDKSNYRIILISVLIVAFGFVLMSGTTDIYSATKIVIAPLLVLAGFALGFYAVLKKPGSAA